jgi:condensin complex subunit 3
MPARVQQPTEEEKRAQLCVSIRQIFEQAGNTAANHNKNYVVLFKIHQEFAGYMEYIKKGKRELVKLTGEKQFQDTFKHMLVKVLPLKKGETTGDRIVKFVGGYIRYINEQGRFILLDLSNDL